MILNINKPLGITSYDVIRQLKKKYPGEKIGHAGTLDPLAEGVLICLIGKDSTKKQSDFMNVSKEYEFDVLFGFETDTYDILGHINKIQEYEPIDVQVEIEKNLNTGYFKQPVPPFSAVKIRGKPLYRWYLEGRISEIEMPSKIINVESIEVLASQLISDEDLKSYIVSLLSSVKSGFRQDTISDKWKDFFAQNSIDKKQNKFLITRFRANVSKGAYVRAIAYDLGQKLKTGACTLTIKRTRVGDFSVEDSEIIE